MMMNGMLLAAQAQLEWSVPVEMPVPLGLAGAIAGVCDNHLLLAGGTNFPGRMPWDGGAKQYYDSIYTLTDSGYRWRSAGRLEEPVAYAASVTTTEGVVFMGGENANGLLRRVVRCRWRQQTNDVTQERLPDLPVAVSNAAAACLGGQIFLVGGECKEGVSDRCWMLDAAGANWQELPRLPGPVSHAVLIADEKRKILYLAGGRKRNAGGPSDLYGALYTWRPGNTKWERLADLPHPQSAGTGIALPDGDFLLFGGDRGEVFSRVEALIAAIGAETDSIKKAVLLEAKADLQSHHPGFSSDILRYRRKLNNWRKEGTIPFPSPVTTNAFYWKDRIVIPGGEIRAGVRTAQILTATIRHDKK